jgi:hypothetical protein
MRRFNVPRAAISALAPFFRALQLPSTRGPSAVAGYVALDHPLVRQVGRIRGRSSSIRCRRPSGRIPLGWIAVLHACEFSTEMAKRPDDDAGAILPSLPLIIEREPSNNRLMSPLRRRPEKIRHWAQPVTVVRYHDTAVRLKIDEIITGALHHQFLSNLLHANQSLSHANRVSGRSFPALRESISRIRRTDGARSLLLVTITSTTA